MPTKCYWNGCKYIWWDLNGNFPLRGIYNVSNWPPTVEDLLLTLLLAPVELHLEMFSICCDADDQIVLVEGDCGVLESAQNSSDCDNFSLHLIWFTSPHLLECFKMWKFMLHFFTKFKFCQSRFHEHIFCTCICIFQFKFLATYVFCICICICIRQSKFWSRYIRYLYLYFWDLRGVNAYWEHWTKFVVGWTSMKC